MTREHFDRIALILQDDIPDPVQRYRVADHLVDEFERFSNFDKDRFLRACARADDDEYVGDIFA